MIEEYVSEYYQPTNFHIFIHGSREEKGVGKKKKAPY